MENSSQNQKTCNQLHAEYQQFTELCSIIRDMQMHFVEMQHRLVALQKANPDLPFALFTPIPVEY